MKRERHRSNGKLLHSGNNKKNNNEGEEEEEEQEEEEEEEEEEDDDDGDDFFSNNDNVEKQIKQIESSKTSKVMSQLTGYHGEFMNVQLFTSRYQRNNKRGGLKNLRCFPTCSPKHQVRGFCGRESLVKIHVPKPGNYFCWAEFIRIDDLDKSLLKAGDQISSKQALMQERSKSQPLNPWIKGELVLQSSNDEITFEFNREKRGWHYGWTSNKHTCNAVHCLQVYVFELIAPDVLLCEVVFRSPSFIIFCRRRRRFAVAAAAAAAAAVAAAAAAANTTTTTASSSSFSVPEPPKSKRKIPNFFLDNIRMDALMRRILAYNKSLDLMTPMPFTSPGIKESDLAIFEDHFMLDALDYFTQPTSSSSQADIFTNNNNNPTFDEFDDEISMDSLIRYLSESQSLKQSLQALKDQQTGLPDYSEFSNITKRYIETYMETNHISLADFDRIFLAPTTNIMNSPSKQHVTKNTFSNTTTTTTTTTNNNNNNIYHHHMSSTNSNNLRHELVPDISGSWRQTEQSARVMQALRAKSDTPWVLSKVFEFMENKFDIRQHGITVECEIRGIFSVPFILDGQSHPWGLRIPFLSGLSSNWTYRAWVEDGKIVVSHSIGHQRLTRQLWCNPAHTRLFVSIILEELNDGEYFVKSRTSQEAVLVV